MDRKNYRAGGTVGITPSAAASTNAVITGDDTQDEAVVWKRVLADLQRLSEIIDSNEGVITALDKVPEGRSNRSVTLCQEAAEKAREEGETIQRALEGVNLLMALRDGDLTNVDNTPEGKRKKRKIEAEGLISNSKKIRRYSSTDPNGIIPVGHQVAARTPKDKNKVEEWILARVLAYYADKNRYHVEDDEADENGEKMKYQLSARSVIMIADDQEDIPEFPAGHTVLALYPSTTCFYKAIVVQPPSKNKDYPTPLYRIKFDDDEGNERTAPPRMVLDMPKLK
ncbi:SAGA HAT/Core module component [Entomortierella chlamydospora]|uniref:SAGA HAT/Core module component n=1 Tax=Entomortierella chlamydospora TaxID=101097 RepID=A0A9P6MYW1_9FUNG|nr:SAGA HAT/Core module component [Entomortierella chlamydospora]KAG0017531.1 SAGA HAT/Core module component [Entomortierella chlamydospora]